MAYNRQIHSFAPLPSGPLPTQEELDALIRRANYRRHAELFTSLRRAFKG